MATRSGRPEAFLALYDRYRDLAWRIARSVARTDVDAEDAVAEAFARMYAAIPRRDIECFRSYLAATVRHVATDLHRRREHPAAGVDLASAPDVDADERLAPSVEEAALEWSDHEQVTKAFYGLPERYRTALWLSEVEAFTPAEVGAVLGLSPNGAAALTMRARRRLRERWLTEQIAAPASPECARILDNLPAYVRGRGARRSDQRVDEHVETCESCREQVARLESLSRSLAALVPAAPAALLTGEELLSLVGSGPDGSWSSGVNSIATGGRAPSHLTGWVDAGGHLATNAPAASVFGDRVLQPVAAAVAGLLVSGAVAIGAPGMGGTETPSSESGPGFTEIIDSVGGESGVIDTIGAVPISASSDDGATTAGDGSGSGGSDATAEGSGEEGFDGGVPAQGDEDDEGDLGGDLADDVDDLGEQLDPGDGGPSEPGNDPLPGIPNPLPGPGGEGEDPDPGPHSPVGSDSLDAILEDVDRKTGEVTDEVDDWAEESVGIDPTPGNGGGTAVETAPQLSVSGGQQDDAGATSTSASTSASAEITAG